MEFTLFQLTEQFHIAFRVDEVSLFFAVLMSIMWFLIGLYAVDYMKHAENKGRFFLFYGIVYVVVMGLDFSANLITLYLFYMIMTFMSVPLILQELTNESVKAAVKYLYYSIAGGLLALFGIFVFAQFGMLDFVAGGALNEKMFAERSGLILGAVLCMVIGFGATSGMFPLHAWISEAYPVVPPPVSAMLSCVITNVGVLGIIRVVFYIVGANVLRGTFVQYVWMVLALLTVLMGSMRAYQEKVLNKRLAYSTVSQVSYVLFGLSTLHPVGFIGAMLYSVSHSVAKNMLFMGVGAIIRQTGKISVDELRGIGKKMPITIWCITLAGLALSGIPPFAGFVSTWYLAQGSFGANLVGFDWIGPAILLVSTLLVAGYLLPIIIDGFFPGKEYDTKKLPKCEAGWKTVVPMIVLAIFILLFGVFLTPLMELFKMIATAIF